jgi:fatty acid desaturase
MNASAESPDDWRKREIMRLLFGLIQIIGAIASICFLVIAGFGWLSGAAIVITISLFFLSRLRLSRN